METLGSDRTRRLSLIEGFFYSLMVGIGETYLVAYALHLGISERKAAIIGILPIVVGSFIQFFTLRAFRSLLSYRKMMVAFSFLQGLFLIATSAAQSDALKGFQFELLFFCATGYWSLALAAGPTWNAWVGQLIEPGKQKSFFLLRNACLHSATLFALICAGLLLEYSDTRSDPYLFVKLFLIAGVFRLLSSYFISKHPDVNLNLHASFKLPHFKYWMTKKHVRFSFIYTFVLYSGVHVSSSFFSPYMLEELKLSYFDYTVLLAIALASRSISGYLMGAVTKKHGVQRMFLLGYLFIVPLPFLWTLSNDYIYLGALQILSGLAWGAHEMGLTLYLLESIDHEERSRLLSWNQFVASIGMLFGITFGSYLAKESDLSLASYKVIFETSTYIRCLAILFIGGFIAAINPGKVPMRFLSVRPGGGGILRPVISRIRFTITKKHSILNRRFSRSKKL